MHKVIAKGHHGCIVAPALKCKNHTVDINDNVVSKIFKEKKSWGLEYEESLKISKIKDYEKYFIVPFEACIVDDSQFGIWNDCKIIKSEPVFRELYQVLMKKGGISLREYIAKKIHITIDEWFNVLLQILAALKILAENRLAHMDIKLDNIMYDGTTVKLIDFGLTTSYDNIYDSVYKTSYLYWPIEFKIYENCIDRTTCFAHNLQNELMETTLYDRFQDIYNDFEFIPKNESQRFTLIEKIIKKSTKERLKSDEYLSKIDIYSLGITCMLIDKNLIRTYPGKDYNALVKAMCNIDCEKRISIDDAINIIKGRNKRTLRSNSTKKNLFIKHNRVSYGE